VVVPSSVVFVDAEAGRVLDIPALLEALGLVKTRSEARRLIDQRGVRWDGEELTSYDRQWPKPDDELVGTVWQVGKRRFARVAGLN
jgi:tyrosyl-tRNA synthetase